MTVSFIEALPSTRLFELWLEQKVLDDRLAFRFGQLSADSEFLVSDSAGAFLNATWGWPSIAGVNLPDGGPAYPLAAPAARLAFNPNDQLSLLLGVFSGDPADDCPENLPQVCNPHGLDFNFSSPLILAEMGIRYNQGEGELAGTLKLGAWKLFGTFEQQATGNAGLPIGLQPVPGVLDEHDHALYIMLDQMIYRLPGDGDPKGVTVFGRLIGAPSEGNMIDHYWDAGIIFDGVLVGASARHARHRLCLHGRLLADHRLQSGAGISGHPELRGHAGGKLYGADHAGSDGAAGLPVFLEPRRPFGQSRRPECADTQRRRVRPAHDYQLLRAS